MITAKEAGNRTKNNLKQKKSKWNIFDSIQYKRIELKIKFWSKMGRNYIYFNYPRSLVREKLEKSGFEIVCFGGANVANPGIKWKVPDNEKSE